MKPTQEQALDLAFECDFVESTPAEDVFSSIYVCCPKDIERLVALAYEAGRKDENEACAKVCKTGTGEPIQMKTLEILRKERERIAAAIRARMNPPQREWVGLTDEEQNELAWSCGAMSADWLDFAHAIEAKLKEKNDS